eukprot:COSAG01_NODE_37472_length_503_cov_0.732673_1_plen_66_part_00
MKRKQPRREKRRASHNTGDPADNIMELCAEVKDLHAKMDKGAKEVQELHAKMDKVLNEVKSRQAA